MKTFCFIGSDKNAGKTTAFNFIYYRSITDNPGNGVCINSFGINGEAFDQYNNKKKPLIRIMKNSFFIIECRHLKNHTGKYETLRSFKPPYIF